MTDEMRAREEAICKAAKVNSIGEVSDGFHTFNGLYEQRMVLFAALVKAYKDKAWKSYRHEDGEYCFGGGWFIVGIDTPEGSYTYHYENKYWDMFDCMDLQRGKHWDGHTEKDVTRLMSLPSAQETHEERTETHACDLISRQAAIDKYGDWYVEEGTAEGFIGTVKQLLEGLPSAQTEIVRCKDCKWYELPSHKITENCVRWMKSNGIPLLIKPNDFCSFAERREDG